MRGFQIRERVRSGDMTARQAIVFLAERRREGHHVKPSILRWLHKRVKEEKQ